MTQRRRGHGRPSDASDMTLEELVFTQRSGWTPGEEYRRRKESPWSPGSVDTARENDLDRRQSVHREPPGAPPAP